MKFSASHDAPPSDLHTYRARSDGFWRTDSGQEYHERGIEQGKALRARAEATYARCKTDPLLKELDEVLNRAGVEKWNERYLLIDVLERLIAARTSPTNQDQSSVR